MLHEDANATLLYTQISTVYFSMSSRRSGIQTDQSDTSRDCEGSIESIVEQETRTLTEQKTLKSIFASMYIISHFYNVNSSMLGPLPCSKQLGRDQGGAASHHGW